MARLQQPGEATGRDGRQEAPLGGSSSLLGKVVLSAACCADNLPHYKNQDKCSSDMVGRPINHASCIMSNSDFTVMKTRKEGQNRTELVLNVYYDLGNHHDLRPR
jgi:hypothetical protein